MNYYWPAYTLCMGTSNGHWRLSIYMLVAEMANTVKSCPMQLNTVLHQTQCHYNVLHQVAAQIKNIKSGIQTNTESVEK